MACQCVGASSSAGALDLSAPAAQTAWRGQDRVVLLGPQAQAALRPLVDRVPPPGPDDFLFRPADAAAERHRRQRAARRTPRWPAHLRVQARRKAARRRATFKPQYTVNALNRALYRACDDAGVPRWSSGLLRKAAATRLRREVGLEAARLLLGHTAAGVTAAHHAERDEQALQALIARHG